MGGRDEPWGEAQLHEVAGELEDRRIAAKEINPPAGLLWQAFEDLIAQI
jgi:hypothetical protein